MTVQLPSLSDTLDLLNSTGKILFTHESNNMVSFKQGNVTYRTNKVFIDSLEKLATDKQLPVLRSSQIEHGSARRGISIVTGTYLVRLFPKL